MKITLKDGSSKEYASSMSVIDIAKDISEGLARVACAGEIDGERVDLRHVVDKDCTLSILTFDDKGGRDAFRHTTSHIMAQAIKRLWPDVKLAIGPSIDDGFYYDIDSERPITEEDFPAIEAEMKKIAKEDLKLERFELPRADAIKMMEDAKEPYKVELIQDLPEDAVISFYKQGDFTDLCAGPHLMSTKNVKAVKLMKVAGAYWRGNEKNKMLTRIYGTSYTKTSDLEDYLTKLEEAKKRDHRKIGKEMGLFMMADEGPGFPFFLPNGMILRNELMKYWREVHYRNGYQEIETPVMLNQSLWITSGHWDHYSENMYTSMIDDEMFCIKPMNCPG
ncbi:MAG: TGS domain-containing protein, partial [Lachnospiraceae bacterium]|nr:TGS domain-containing protein [Lachnospiraceae bacterium]